MNPSLDEDIVQRVNDLGSAPWSGIAFRYTSVGRDPRSGTGARLFGGRWNPRGVFATIYLALPLAACLAELDRRAQAAGWPVPALIAQGQELHTIAARDLQVLDLRSDAALNQVGLTTDDIADEDWTACQTVGHAAYFLGYNGVLAPSATGLGLVTAAFASRLAPGQLEVQGPQLLTEDQYHRNR